MSAPSVMTIGPGDVLELRFPHSADLSPDGRRVVQAVSRVDHEAKQDRVTLHLLDIESGAERPLTTGAASDTCPAWSPDGSLIAFVSTRTGQPQLFVIAPDGGEARQLTSLPHGVVGPPAWSPDGSLIAFSALGSEERRDPALPYRVTRTYYRLDGLGYIEDALLDIHVVDAAGGDPRRLTRDGLVNGEPRWTPDGTALAYLAGCEPDSSPLLNRVRLVDLHGNVRDIDHPAGLVTGRGFAADGRIVLAQSLVQGRPPGSRGELFVADPATGRVEARATALDVSPGGSLQFDAPVPIWPTTIEVTRHGEALATVQTGGRVGIRAFALAGPQRAREVVGGDRTAMPLRLRGDRLLFHAAAIDEPGDLYLAELNAEREPAVQRLTRWNAGLLAARALPDVVHLAFQGADGTPVEGWFLAPAGGEAPHPTVLYIHGGPHSGFGHTWHSDMQLLAGAGFGVLIVNQRGSTGYGDAFATSLVGRWGEHDCGDLMAGVDHAIERGLADRDRLGVCGLSGGGNLTCWIIGQTDRFRAAVPENPVTNFVSFYGVSDVGPWFASAELGGQPWERLEAYLRMSPITYAHRCRTPTLLVQGESDLRCPAEQSEQFYAVLRANGCVAEMLRLPNSSHTGAILGQVPVRTAQNEALIEWMRRYVLPGKTEAAAEPAIAR